MYIRFATDRLDEDTGKPLGVFSVAYQLIESESLQDYQYAEIRATLDWFKKNLPIPTRFTRSRRPHREDKGICWFKVEAADCMKHVRYLVHLVAEHDVVVREIVTDSPGYLIYEDQHQVVAEPFAETEI